MSISTYEFEVDDYRRMMDADFAAAAQPFFDDEGAHLEQLFDTSPTLTAMHCIVVGAVGLPHLDMIAGRTQGYVALDPLLEPENEARGDEVDMLPCSLRELDREALPDGQLLWVFHFNVFPYIRETSVLHGLLRRGDVLAISSWARTTEAKAVRHRYLDKVYESLADDHWMDPSPEMMAELTTKCSSPAVVFPGTVADLTVITAGCS